MSSLVLAADTLLSTPTVGSLEFDGKSFYSTPLTSQRGLVPGAQYYRLNADYAGASSTSAQGIFSVGTGGTGLAVTLSGSTIYEFDMYLIFSKSATATAHNFQLGFGGTATINNILYGGAVNGTAASFAAGAVAAAQSFDSNTATATTVYAAAATATMSVRTYLRGSVSIGTGGTFIPQYTTSAAVGPYSTLAGSFMYIYPLGTSGGAISVGSWS